MKSKFFVIFAAVLLISMPFASAGIEDLVISLGQNYVINSVPAIGQIYSAVQIAQQIVTVSATFATGGIAGVAALGGQVALSTLVNIAGEKGLEVIVGKEVAGTVLQIQNYGKILLKDSEFKDIKIGKDGVIESGSIKIKQADGTDKKLEIKNLKFSSDENSGLGTYTFEKDGTLAIGNAVYKSIAEGGTIKIDNKGNLVEAKITSTAAATYVFENEKLSVLPGTEITYKDGKITVHNEGLIFRYGATDFFSLTNDVTFVKTKDGLMVYNGIVQINDKRDLVINAKYGNPVLLVDPAKKSFYDAYKGNAVWVSSDGIMFDAKGDGFSVEKSGINFNVLQNGRIQRDENTKIEIIAGNVEKESGFNLKFDSIALDKSKFTYKTKLEPPYTQEVEFNGQKVYVIPSQIKNDYVYPKAVLSNADVNGDGKITQQEVDAYLKTPGCESCKKSVQQILKESPEIIDYQFKKSIISYPEGETGTYTISENLDYLSSEVSDDITTSFGDYEVIERSGFLKFSTCSMQPGITGSVISLITGYVFVTGFASKSGCGSGIDVWHKPFEVKQDLIKGTYSVHIGDVNYPAESNLIWDGNTNTYKPEVKAVVNGVTRYFNTQNEYIGEDRGGQKTYFEKSLTSFPAESKIVVKMGKLSDLIPKLNLKNKFTSNYEDTKIAENKKAMDLWNKYNEKKDFTEGEKNEFENLIHALPGNLYIDFKVEPAQKVK